MNRQVKVRANKAKSPCEEPCWRRDRCTKPCKDFHNYTSIDSRTKYNRRMREAKSA